MTDYADFSSQHFSSLLMDIHEDGWKLYKGKLHEHNTKQTSFLYYPSIRINHLSLHNIARGRLPEATPITVQELI